MSSDREPVWVGQIVENAEAARRYTDGMTEIEFGENQLVLDAVERCLSRLAEAAKRIGPDRFSIVSPSTPLHLLNGLGNRLRHEYDNIYGPTIFFLVRNELPNLISDCRAFLNR